MSAILSLWRCLPVIIRAVLTGIEVAAVGTTPWAALSWANLKYWPAVPWAAPLTALYLWPFWQYLRGAGWPRSTAEARRTILRLPDEFIEIFELAGPGKEF